MRNATVSKYGDEEEEEGEPKIYGSGGEFSLLQRKRGEMCGGGDGFIENEGERRGTGGGGPDEMREEGQRRGEDKEDDSKGEERRKQSR